MIPTHKIPRVVFLLLAGTLLLLSTVPAPAQETGARPDRGAMPGAAYSVSDLESVSLTNGNMNVSIPLASLPPMAGGKLGLTLSAVYNSKLWNVTRTEYQALYTQGCQSWVVSTPQLSEVGGWRIAGGQYQIVFRDAREDFDYVVPPSGPPGSCESDTAEYNRLMSHWKRVVLIGPDGAEHELRPVDNYQPYGPTGGSRPYLFNYYKDTPQTTNSPMRYYSFDGSFLWAVINPAGYSTQWTVYLKDGTKIVQTSDGIQRITDTNGNSIKIFGDLDGESNPVMHYQDEQTGREIKYTDDPTGNNGGRQTRVEYQTVTGAWQTTKINWDTTDVRGKLYRVEDWTPFGGESGEGVHCYYDVELGTDLVVIGEIVFPVTEPGVAPRRFSFEYNSDETESATDQAVWSCSMAPQSYTRTASKGMGGLSQITTPSGAIANYAYSRDNEHSFTLFSETDLIAKETVTQKQLTHDGTTETWTYEIDEVAGNGGSVTGPDGSTTTESSYSHNPALSMYFGPNSGKAGLVFRSSQSNKVRTERHWTTLLFDGGNPGAAGSIGQLQSFNPVVDAEYTTLLDDTPSHNPVKMSAKTFQYDYNGNLLSTTEYDWFDPALVTYGSDAVPTGVPAGATVLRTTNNTFHNAATSSNSANVYAKRSLSSATPLILNAPQQSTAGAAIVQLSYDGNSYGVAPTVGNLTSKSVWFDLESRWITTSSTYGLYGNIATVTDARGKVTQFFYDDATHALPNRVVVDPQNDTGTQTTTTAYDYSTGLVVSVTDANDKTSTIDYTNQLLPGNAPDPFGRPGVSIGPDIGSGVNHSTRTIYEDNARTVTVLSDLNSEGDGLLKSQVISDMLGRTIESRQYENASDFIAVRKTYDIPNRLSKTSNPFRAGETVVWTTALTDILGRTVSVTTPDNAVVTSAYDANFTTVTDQAGKQRRSIVDALARLVRVDEPDANGNLGTTASPNQPTNYTYDVLGNLRTVSQGAQTRYFMHDSLSRLVRARNPEQGTLAGLNLTDPLSGNSQWSCGYAYDDNGNLTSKTDARSITTTYIYDALNRATSRSYSEGTPTVTYAYDSTTITNGKGRLASVSSSVSTYSYSGYDAAGKVLGGSQIIGAQTYTMSYGYNLAGHVTSMTYPSNRTVTNTYDNAGRLSSFTGNLGEGGTHRTYSAGISYSSFGGMKWEQYGTATPLYHKTFYNIRGQMFDTRVSSVNDTWDWNRGRLILYYSSNHQWGASGTDNNGNVHFMEHWIPPPNATLDQAQYLIEHSYDYDSLNRLSSVAERTLDIGGGGSWTPRFAQAYAYDRYGNRTINAGATWGTGINNKQFTVDPNNNRLGVPSGQSGAMSYDSAGNLTTDTYSGMAVTRVYDAENKMTSETTYNSVVAGSYSYDGDGRRVKRIVGGVETWQVYGVGGELLAEYPANADDSTPQKEYGYRNGELLITATVTTGWGAPPSYTGPNPLSTGDQIKLENLTELRSAVNQLRQHAGLAAFNFSVDPNPQQNVTQVKADHIRQLRTALEEARTALGLSIGGYEHPTLTENFSLIFAVDFQELRGQVLSAWQSGGGVDLRWLVADHLGTPRMIFDQTGSLANVSRHDYLPFGEEVPANFRTGMSGYGTGDDVRQKFTLYERDIETGLDYAQARYYANAQGRFTGVDPVMMTADRLYDPQQINLYAYCRNNPLAFIDPTGETISFNDKDSEKAFNEYEKFINKDPKKYAKEIATLKQLRDSDVNYIPVLGGKQVSETAEGNTVPDAAGKNILVRIRNVGGAHGEKMDRNGRFAHELEHARQFDSGELAFAKTQDGRWYPLSYDIYDEVNAYNSIIRVAPPIKDTPLLKSLRDDRNSDSDRARKLRGSYPRTSKEPSNVNYAWGAKPGELVRPAANRPYFGRVYDPSRSKRQ